MRLGVPPLSLVFIISHFHCSKGSFPPPFCNRSRDCCTPIFWLCFHLCGKGAGFSYFFSTQVLTPSLTPGPVGLSPVQTGCLQFHSNTPNTRHSSFLFKSLAVQTSLKVFGRRFPRALSFPNLTKWVFFQHNLCFLVAHHRHR